MPFLSLVDPRFSPIYWIEMLILNFIFFFLFVNELVRKNREFTIESNVIVDIVTLIQWKC